MYISIFQIYEHNYENDDIKGTAALILTVQLDISWKII